MSNIVSGLQALFGRSDPPKPVAAPAPLEYFRPTFEKPVGYGPNGCENRLLNPDYFATVETAEWIQGHREIGPAVRKIVHHPPVLSKRGRQGRTNITFSVSVP